MSLTGQNPIYALNPSGIAVPVAADAAGKLILSPSSGLIGQVEVLDGGGVNKLAIDANGVLKALLEVVSGTPLVADQTNSELRVSLYGTNTTPGDTALAVNSLGVLKVLLQQSGANVSANNPINVNDVLGAPITASNTGAAGASNSATLAGAAAKTTYLTMAIFSTQAPAALEQGVGTITGLISGTISFDIVESATTGFSLILPFPTPIPASAQNTAIVGTIPAITSGAATAIALFGFQL